MDGKTLARMLRRFDPDSPNGRLMIAVCETVMSVALAAARQEGAAAENEACAKVADHEIETHSEYDINTCATARRIAAAIRARRP